MMGITPMIGKNDDGSTFTLADAQTVAGFASQNGVGLISYWAFQRDRAQSGYSNNLVSDSGVPQGNYQYLNIFKSAGGGFAPPPPPPASAGCNSSSWVQGRQYAAGSVVSYPDGNVYIANASNPGYNPTISTYYWARYAC
jgi:chitinase